MSGRIMLAAAPLLLAACATAPVAQQRAPAANYADWAAACEDWDDWDKPGPAIQVHGNTWYVGTCGISAILVADDAGLVLIDSGTEAGAETVLANIESLGFFPSEITHLLMSHEHFDHVGGMAFMQQATGAPLLALDAAVPVMRSGMAAANDPQLGMHDPMPPVSDVQTIADGESIPSTSQFTAIATPGHTPGAMTWTWDSCDARGDCLRVVYADSLSAISSDEYRFSDHPEYVAAFRDGLARLAELECDILLTPHPSGSQMRDKLLAGDVTQGMNCAEYAEIADTRLTERLAREAAQ